ncbi:LLM class F420-dependent oxidoreductase [soil metagenome]
MFGINDVRVFTEPQQGATYDELLAVAQRAEALGFGAFFRSDHYVSMGDSDGTPGPSDAWITLAGLARDTESIRLGTLVTSATFRHPGVLAISVANVDAMSGGRVDLGIGAGWYEVEHDAYGIPFPDLGDRFDRLEETLDIVTGLWSTPTGERFSYDGDHFRVTNSPALPKPVQQPVPLIVGGSGKQRTPRLAARFATEFNTPFMALDEFVAQRQRVLDACQTADRDPASIIISAALIGVVGAEEQSFRRRADAIGRDPAELRESGLAGTPDEVVATMGEWHEAGAERLYVQILDLADLDHLDEFATLVSGA